ncbi:zinc ribbon domain-containing protein [Virgibacillus doumboii]|uniref:zinc ribbon domain-containing protein n=1 Tax=Virgibacillus doumboii TaxID=2697503 RepID=UPI0013DF4863|nr:zinc ribbon domain-containing protein [Virgibacillus doumboii]
MYCNECGTENDDHAIYCVEDGYPLQQPSLAGSLQIRNEKFCGKCMTERKFADRYCMECGNSFDTYDSAKQAYEIEHTYFNKALGMKVLPGFILSIAVLFILNQIFASLMKAGTGQFNGIFLGLNFPNHEKITTLDYVLFSNLISTTTTMKAEEFSNQVSYLSSGMIFPVLMVILALAAGGFLIKYLHPQIEAWKAAAVFAGAYALVLGALSFGGGAEYMENITRDTVRHTFQFSTTSAIINGIILGFFFSYAGMALKRGVLTKKLYVFAYQRALYFGTYAFIAVYGVLLLITAFLHAQYEPETQMNVQRPELPWYTTIAIVSKLAVYVFNLVFFNTFVMKDTGTESEPIEYSFLTGLSDKEMEGLPFLLPPEMFASYEVILIVLVAVIFLFIGRLLGESQQHIMKTVIMYSLVFAVLFTFFTYHASMNYQVEHDQMMEEAMKIFVGFGTIKTFVITALYAGVTGFIGAQTRKLF